MQGSIVCEDTHLGIGKNMHRKGKAVQGGSLHVHACADRCGTWQGGSLHVCSTWLPITLPISSYSHCQLLNLIRMCVDDDLAVLAFLATLVALHFSQ